MKWTGITHNDANLQKNKEMGWYSAPTAVEGTKTHWIEGSPMNCITECQMNCTAAYTEGPMMLKRNKDGGCADCLRYCTHPWGKNIEDCHVSPNCTTAHTNHKGIKNFCQPLAMCFQMCAGRGYKKIDVRAGQTKYQSGPVGWNNAPKDGGTKGKAWTTAGYEIDKDGKTKVAWYGPTGKSYRCIRECEYDGRLAVGFGIFALVVVWLAPLCLHIGSSYPEMHSVLSFLIASICWTASLILAADAFNLNMGRAKGRGWAMLYFENLPVDYEIIGGTTSSGQLKVTLNWMLHVIYGLALLANLFTVLAYYDPAEIWNRRPKPPKEDDSKKQPTPIPSKPKPTAMSYYGEDQAKEEEMMAAGAAGLTGEGKNFPVEIGLTWTRSQHNNVSEVVIKEVIPGGPADEACKSGMNGKNVPQPGDVVLLVGNVVATNDREDRADMHNVYGQPYSDWKDMVFSQPGGTKVSRAWIPCA